MSSSTAIALIIANFLPAFFLYFYLSEHANDQGEKITTGIVRGVKVSTKYRSIMLYFHWLGYVAGAISCGMVCTVLNLGIAAYVTDAQVKTLAHVPAFMGGMGAIGWLYSAGVQAMYYRSVLRQAEAD